MYDRGGATNYECFCPVIAILQGQKLGDNSWGSRIFGNVDLTIRDSIGDGVVDIRSDPRVLHVDGSIRVGSLNDGDFEILVLGQLDAELDSEKVVFCPSVQHAHCLLAAPLSREEPRRGRVLKLRQAHAGNMSLELSRLLDAGL